MGRVMTAADHDPETFPVSRRVVNLLPRLHRSDLAVLLALCATTPMPPSPACESGTDTVGWSGREMQERAGVGHTQMHSAYQRLRDLGLIERVDVPEHVPEARYLIPAQGDDGEEWLVSQREWQLRRRCCAPRRAAAGCSCAAGATEPPAGDVAGGSGFPEPTDSFPVADWVGRSQAQFTDDAVRVLLAIAWLRHHERDQDDAAIVQVTGLSLVEVQLALAEVSAYLSRHRPHWLSE